MSGTAKNGKLKPKFQTVDEIALDATGKEFKTGKQLYDVQLGQIDPIKKELLREELITKYKADPEDITKMFNQFNQIRDKWSELFTAMGRRFNPEALKSFEDMIPKYINDVLDRGYEYVKATGRNPIQLANNNRPSATLIKEAVKEFQDIAAQKGLTLPENIAKDMVDEIWKGAYLPGGITIGKTTAPGQVRFAGAVPAFMKDSLASTLDNKSILDPKYHRLYNTNVSELSGVPQAPIKKLLGKAQNPMSTIVDGTANLSSVVRSQQFFDDLILKNIKLDYIFFDGPEDPDVALHDINLLEDWIDPGCYFSMHDWETETRKYDGQQSIKSLKIRSYIESNPNIWEPIEVLDGINSYDSVGFCLYKFLGK